MKSLKLIVFRIVTMAITFATSGAFNPVYAETPAMLKNSDRFQKDNTGIRDDISSIRLARENILQLDEKYKKDKVDGQKESVILDKRNLQKARADLNWNEMYLIADKRVLFQDRKLAIKSCRHEINMDKSKLSICKNKLNKDIAKGNEVALANDAGNVVQYQNELKKDKARLLKERKNLYSDMVAINKEIQKVSGQFAAVTYSETAYVTFKDWLSK